MIKTDKKIMLGDIELLCLSDGSIYFDAGAMFHLIPKTLWDRKIVVDENNRMEIALNSLYLEFNGQKILIDAGAGTKYTTKLQKIFKRNAIPYLLQDMQNHGIDRNEIDVVLLSHLHRDHAGGLSFYTDNTDNIELAFPHATHIVSKEEWEFANAGNELSRVSYVQDDFMPVYNAGLFDFVTTATYKLNNNITMIKTSAHSLGHSAFIIEDKGETLLFPSDIIPTRHHVTLNWTCSYDYHSYQVVEEKRKLLALAVKRNALVYLVHEVEQALGRIKQNDDGSYYWQAVSTISI